MKLNIRIIVVLSYILQYIRNSNRLFDACIDAMGFVYMDQFSSAEHCAAAIVTEALLYADFVGEDA